jgi:hypothetical protein
MRVNKFIFIIIGCFFFASCSVGADANENGSQSANLCYVPFDVSTSTPMTLSTFSHSCADIGEIDIEDKRFLEIFSLINESKSGDFLDDGIRVKVTLPDSRLIYIDDAGGVFMGNSKVKLDRRDFLKVRKIITNIAREKGIPGLP